MKRLKDLLTNYKPPKQRKKKNQIVLSVPSATMRTRERFGVLVKWKPIMYQLGARVAKQLPKIVRCCAKRTIEQKVIGKSYGNNFALSKIQTDQNRIFGPRWKH